MGVNGNWLLLGASLKWPPSELQPFAHPIGLIAQPGVLPLDGPTQYEVDLMKAQGQDRQSKNVEDCGKWPLNPTWRASWCVFHNAHQDFLVCLVMIHLCIDFCEDCSMWTQFNQRSRGRYWAILPRPFQITLQLLLRVLNSLQTLVTIWACLGPEKAPKGKYKSFQIQ